MTSRILGSVHFRSGRSVNDIVLSESARDKFTQADVDIWAKNLGSVHLRDASIMIGRYVFNGNEIEYISLRVCNRE